MFRSFGSFGVLTLRREDLLEVPLPICVLHEVHVRMLDLEPGE